MSVWRLPVFRYVCFILSVLHKRQIEFALSDAHIVFFFQLCWRSWSRDDFVLKDVRVKPSMVLMRRAWPFCSPALLWILQLPLHSFILSLYMNVFLWTTVCIFELVVWKLRGSLKQQVEQTTGLLEKCCNKRLDYRGSLGSSPAVSCCPPTPAALAQ